MQNHPHDSICGCSIDPVHREMMTRFRAVGDIGDSVIDARWTRLLPADDRAAGDDRVFWSSIRPRCREFPVAEAESGSTSRISSWGSIPTSCWIRKRPPPQGIRPGGRPWEGGPLPVLSKRTGLRHHLHPVQLSAPDVTPSGSPVPVECEEIPPMGIAGSRSSGYPIPEIRHGTEDRRAVPGEHRWRRGEGQGRSDPG